MIHKTLRNPKIWLGLAIMVVGFILALQPVPPEATSWTEIRTVYWWWVVGAGFILFGVLIIGVGLARRQDNETAHNA